MAGGVCRFEDLIAWQLARTLTADVYRLTGEGSLSKDFGLKDQMRRAAVSIMSNFAEGFERGRPAEFHQYVSVAKASCAELRSQLYVALDAGLISPERFHSTMAHAHEVARVVGGLRSSIQRNKEST